MRELQALFSNVGPDMANAPRNSSATFTWNHKTCNGSQLHVAVLEGKSGMVEKFIAADSYAIHQRFNYTTTFQNQAQEGSGLAIHLAASRGNIEMVQLLLKRGARLDCVVTRDNQNHYDVLHAAVFAEGRSDNTAMVKHLLAIKAPLADNLDGISPLHIAFQVGSLPSIRAIREEMKARGVLESSVDDAKMTPLMWGFKMGKMSELELARAADTTPNNLKLFIKNEPRCVPLFLKRLHQETNLSAQEMAGHLQGRHLATIIRRCPEAAAPLLDGITGRPDEQDPGWHPLPRRMSFGTHTVSEKIRRLADPNSMTHIQYVGDCMWRFDSAALVEPDWHQHFRIPNEDDPDRFDAEISVCHMPNVICAEFFSALAVVDEGNGMKLFENKIVRSCTDYTWWNGAYRRDVFQALVSVWCLALLLFESWRLQSTPAAVKGRHVSSTPPTLLFFLHQGHGLGGTASVAGCFIGAKGWLDMSCELIEFVGLRSIGRGSDYLNFGNLWDLFRSIVLATMSFDTGSTTAPVLVIFISWMRLLDVSTSAERIAVATLPIIRIGNGLGPACVLTCIWFCAFTHAFEFINSQSSLESSFFHSFGTLMTSELPDHPARLEPLKLVITYGAVMFFSVFILNIFIGVIGSHYDQEVSQVPTTFMLNRAQCCLSFLLRTRVLPGKLCSRPCAWLVFVLAALAAFSLQVHMYLFEVLPCVGFIFSALLCVMVLSIYQDPENHFNPDTSKPIDEHSRKLFLWVAVPRMEVRFEEEPEVDAKVAAL